MHRFFWGVVFLHWISWVWSSRSLNFSLLLQYFWELYFTLRPKVQTPVLAWRDLRIASPVKCSTIGCDAIERSSFTAEILQWGPFLSTGEAATYSRNQILTVICLKSLCPWSLPFWICPEVNQLSSIFKDFFYLLFLDAASWDFRGIHCVVLTL